jgi:hypothetical protein
MKESLLFIHHSSFRVHHFILVSSVIAFAAREEILSSYAFCREQEFGAECGEGSAHRAA